MNNTVKQIAAMVLGATLSAAVVVAAFFAYDAYAQEEPVAVQVPENPQIANAIAGFPNPAAFQYQGQLLNPSTGAPISNQALPMTFRLYDQASSDISAALWGEQLSVTVVDGLFSVRLGAQSSNPMPESAFDGRNLWLGVAAGANSNDEATPRQPLSTVPFAVNARFLDGATGSDFVPAKRGPIAYGIINESCGREKGFRFSSGPGANSNECNITVRDSNDNAINYNLNDFVTQVTVVENSNCPGASIATTGSGSGNLIVDMYDSSGNGRRCKFHFITFQP